MASVDRTLDRESAILDAVLEVLANEGVGGVTMRAVARQAGVSLGLANYYFSDKTSLICAALRRIGEQDLEIIDGASATDPVVRVRRVLRRVAADEFMQPSYLALRLQLWSLASVDPTFGEINRQAQQRYLDRLTELLVQAIPQLGRREAKRRANAILVIQNGIWLTAAVIGPTATAHSIDRCEAIALAQPGTTTWSESA